MIEITGATFEAVALHPRTDGTFIADIQLTADDGTTVRINGVIPATGAADLVAQMTYDARYHQPRLRVA